MSCRRVSDALDTAVFWYFVMGNFISAYDKHEVRMCCAAGTWITNIIINNACMHKCAARYSV
jgi:hypothetical protein